MPAAQITFADLKRILLASAGEDEAVDLDGDVLDEPFDALGYESLALLETVGQIEREYGISLGDAVIDEAETPRALLAVINKHLRPPA